MTESWARMESCRPGELHQADLFVCTGLWHFFFGRGPARSSIGRGISQNGTHGLVTGEARHNAGIQPVQGARAKPSDDLQRTRGN
jgi:hypothetical protein